MATTFERRREERRRKRFGYAAVFFMCFLMATLSFGYIQFADEVPAGGVEEEGYVFIPVAGGGYAAEIGSDSLSFDHLPSEVSTISSEPLGLSPGRVYLAYDPSSMASSDYVYQRVAAYLTFTGYAVQEACTQEDGCGDVPVVACSDAKQIVAFASGSDSSISRDQSCLLLTAANGDEVSVTSLFIYKLLGVL